jgi:hypothetical protein
VQAEVKSEVSEFGRSGSFGRSGNIGRSNLEPARVRPGVRLQESGAKGLPQQPAARRPPFRPRGVDILAGSKVQRRSLLKLLRQRCDPRVMISILGHASDCPQTRQERATTSQPADFAAG